MALSTTALHEGAARGRRRGRSRGCERGCSGLLVGMLCMLWLACAARKKRVDRNQGRVAPPLVVWPMLWEGRAGCVRVGETRVWQYPEVGSSGPSCLLASAGWRGGFSSRPMCFIFSKSRTLLVTIVLKSSTPDCSHPFPSPRTAPRSHDFFLSTPLLRPVIVIIIINPLCPSVVVQK